MGINLRNAVREDLGAIVALLADDELGITRELSGGGVAEEYTDAFDAMEPDPNNFIVIAEDGHVVVGCVQVTVTAGLSRLGATRATLEGIRVRRDRRGGGLGEALLTHAIGLARERGATIVQLTTDKQRPDSKRFYERLGFEATHEGMKRFI